MHVLSHKEIRLEMVEVKAESSLSQSMNRALRHYSSLFFLPPFKKAVVALALLCLSGGFSSVVLFPSFRGAIDGLSLGIFFFLANMFFDYAVVKLVLRRDPIFNVRRTVALSAFCWILWLIFIALGLAFGVLFDLWWWIKLCLLGFSAVLALRFVVFLSICSGGHGRSVIASLLQPFACIILLVVFWTKISFSAPFSLLPFLAIAPPICFFSSFLFISLIDRMGQRAIGARSMSLFKAFLLNWVANLNSPFEEILEKLGEEQDVEVSLIEFDSNKLKTAIIVPSVHPGPFKNIGSSLLPSMLKHEFEKKFKCDACVPLGILGHELDLASQRQNQKVIDHIITSARFNVSGGRATPFVRVSDGFATASCQIFSDVAFISFTLAPNTTEDLPQELGQIVRQEAKKLGINCAVIVNAHNSINETADMEESLGVLRKVAVECLEKAASLTALPFEVGAATVIPEEFSLKDGMGPGGITAVVVKVAEQKTAYVVIDGNNMVSGLREKILSALSSIGFDKSEVFTTDTHAVSAVVLGPRGYHPIGEAMNREKLIGCIGEAAKAAMTNLEQCKAGGLRVTVPKVRVIGKARLESLSVLTDKALERAKEMVFPVFALNGLILMLILVIL